LTAMPSASVAPPMGRSSWRIAFWICGCVGLWWVVLFYWWFRDDPAQKPRVNQGELDLIHRDRPADALAVHHQAGASIWAALFSSPSLWAVAIAYMCSSFVWSFFVSWMPKYMNDRFHPNPNTLHWMNTGPLLVGGAACLLGGWMSDRLVRLTGRPRFGRVIFPIVGLAIFGGSMYSIQFVHSARAALALMCLASFGNDLGQAAAWATTIGIGGLYAGTAFGFINTTANAGGNFLQPVVAAHIFTRYGWTPLFDLYGAVLALGCALWFIPDPSRRFYSDTVD